MGLPVKDLPTQLEAEVDDWVWPGDDAVDIEASDLDQWVRHGGSAGLVIHPGGAPTQITIGPLSDRAFRRVVIMMQRGEEGYIDEAFRYGVRRIRGGGSKITMDRIGGIPGLSDYWLDILGELRATLPWGYLHTEMVEAMTGEAADPPPADQLETSLPMALGMVVLARTFRARRGRT